jgi:hypothetical protein
MEAVSNSDNSPILRAYSKTGSLVKSSSSIESEVAATKVQLTDVNSLAAKASLTGDEVRPEAIERGRALLADPNWPNNADIDGLADKLLNSGDFDA